MTETSTRPRFPGHRHSCDRIRALLLTFREALLSDRLSPLKSGTAVRTPALEPRGRFPPKPEKRVKVLGINALFHDPAAALVIDGQTVAAAEEERFSRRKHGHRPV